MSVDNVELLAPSGNWDAFLAAVENGADAVYLGGKLFSARQYASNFDIERLAEAIRYAHVRGVSLYLTMNILMSDEELREAVMFLKEAYLAGIDGVIVQDLGFARLVRNMFPDLPLHASTQMTIHNLEGVKQLEELGFERVVLARELSLKEIKSIADNTSVEIEVFIHGALCISYSGQCLISSIIGGRSGNRGKCAQPCRLPFELMAKEPEKGINIKPRGPYIMSPKDLCSVQLLNKLLEAGVKSLKIEGRMKGPEYVATVVRVYKKYLDRLNSIHGSDAGKKYTVEEKDIRDLTQVFNRGGFSKGYLEGKTGSTMMSYEKPKNWGVYLGEVISYDRSLRTVKLRLEDEISMGDGIEIWNGEDESPGTIVSMLELKGKKADSVEAGETVLIGNVKGNIGKGNKIYKTSDKKLNNAALESVSGKFYRKVPIEGILYIKRDRPAVLTVRDDLGNDITVTGSVTSQEAVNRPITKERVLEQLSKTGATPFEFVNTDAKLDDNLSLPVSEINNIRRSALEQLELKRSGKISRRLSEGFEEKEKSMLYFLGNSRIDNKLKISACIYKFDKEIDYGSLGIDRIYIPFGALLTPGSKELLSNYRDKGMEVYIHIPSITRGNYDNLIKLRLDGLIESGIDGLLAGNIGLIGQKNYLAKPGIMGDYSLNCFNSSSLKQMAELGLGGITLSLELTLKQIKNLASIENFQKEVVVYGRIPLMTSEYCPVGSIVGGLGEKSECKGGCHKGEYYLKDRIGAGFPVMCDRVDCRSTVFNSNVLLMEENIDKIKLAGVNIIRLNFTDETYDEIGEIVYMHRALLDSGNKALKSCSGLIERIKSRGFTKGHYFRGV